MPLSSDSKSRIGIAGYMGAGKSTCAALCAEAFGMRVIDADAEAKLLMENDPRIREELTHVFGPSVETNGALNFGALGTAAFASADDMRKLGSIVHPPLLRRLRDLVFSWPGPSILDAALIGQWRIEEWFDTCLWVWAPSIIRGGCLQEKTGLSPEQIRKRMEVQEALVAEPSDKPWTIIANDGTLDELKSHIAGRFSV